MLLSLAYLVVRMLLRLLVPNSQGEAAKDLEIVVSVMNWASFGDRASGQVFDLPTGHFSPLRLDDCHELAGSASSCRQRRCCAGTGSWSASSGLDTASVVWAGRRCRQRCRS